MQLTTKSEYAIRALIELAKVTDGKPITIKEICERQNLPVKYMEQLFSKLKKGSIVNSLQGAAGGYVLNFSPDNLSIREIMSAVEEDPAQLNCTGEKGQREYCTGQPCHFYSIWQEIKNGLDEYFQDIRLSRFL